MRGRVLVTRPEPGVSGTVARLRALGFVPVLLPLTRIVPIEEQHYPDFGAIDALVITSVNAVRHASVEALRALINKPVYTVGDASANAASLAGFVDVRSASGDARDLAKLIISEVPAGAKLLHIAGVDRTPGFEDAMRLNGLHVFIMESYVAEKISYTTDFLKSLLCDDEISAALMMSPRASRIFSELSENLKINQIFEKTRFFCISSNASVPLSKRFGSQIMISLEPTEESVLALLASQF